MELEKNIDGYNWCQFHLQPVWRLPFFVDSNCAKKNGSFVSFSASEFLNVRRIGIASFGSGRLLGALFFCGVLHICFCQGFWTYLDLAMFRLVWKTCFFCFLLVFVFLCFFGFFGSFFVFCFLCVVSTIISCISSRKGLCMDNNKMQPTNPNAVTQNTFEKQIISTVYIFPLLPYQCTADC